MANFHKVGIVGLVLIALGLSWIPCSYSIIMSGYGYGKQGEQLLIFAISFAFDLGWINRSCSWISGAVE